jgi:hypothetical protein
VYFGRGVVVDNIMMLHNTPNHRNMEIVYNINDFIS